MPQLIENGEHVFLLVDTARKLRDDQLIFYSKVWDYYYVNPNQTLETVLAKKHEYDKNKASQICIIVGEILHLNLENKAMENFIRDVLFSIYPENDPEFWIFTVAELVKKQFPEWETRIDKALNGQTLND